MSADLDRDLGAWERQELSREHLLAAHGTAAATLVAVHERLTGVAAAVPAEKIGTVLADAVGRISLFMRGLAVEMFFSCGGA